MFRRGKRKRNSLVFIAGDVERVWLVCFIDFDVCVSASWNRFLECFLFFVCIGMESQKEPLGAALTTYQPSFDPF